MEHVYSLTFSLSCLPLYSRNTSWRVDLARFLSFARVLFYLSPVSHKPQHHLLRLHTLHLILMTSKPAIIYTLGIIYVLLCSMFIYTLSIIYVLWCSMFIYTLGIIYVSSMCCCLLSYIIDWS